MKPTQIITCCGLLLAAQAALAAPQMRDAATHEELSKVLQKAQQNDPTKRLKPATGEDPSVASKPADLLSTSDIICFGDRATLVPKRAILHLPPKLADRLKFQQGAKFVTWPEFYAQNLGWITTVEVNRVQAEGNKALPEEVITAYQKSSNLVVATCKNGPISMLPPKESAKEQTLTKNVKP